MAKRLPVPAELQHLVEKREQPDRRHQQRRKTTAPPAIDGKTESDSKPADNRRQRKDRRIQKRRTSE